MYLDEAGVPEDLVGVTNEFELLHYSHRLVQVQDDSCGCDAEISLQRQSGRSITTRTFSLRHTVIFDPRVASVNQVVLVLLNTLVSGP